MSCDADNKCYKKFMSRSIDKHFQAHFILLVSATNFRKQTKNKFRNEINNEMNVTEAAENAANMKIIHAK